MRQRKLLPRIQAAPKWPVAINPDDVIEVKPRYWSEADRQLAHERIQQLIEMIDTPTEGKPNETD